MLLNEGAPILIVQTILGRQDVDTTLGYARVYDGTVAADYYRAMAQVESRLNGPESSRDLTESERLLALLDELAEGNLDERQKIVLHQLHNEIITALRSLAMAQRAVRHEAQAEKILAIRMPSR